MNIVLVQRERPWLHKYFLIAYARIGLTNCISTNQKMIYCGVHVVIWKQMSFISLIDIFFWEKDFKYVHTYLQFSYVKPFTLFWHNGRSLFIF
jgi:hypothetical protein